jgi:hypothetical protein
MPTVPIVLSPPWLWSAETAGSQSPVFTLKFIVFFAQMRRTGGSQLPTGFGPEQNEHYTRNALAEAAKARTAQNRSVSSGKILLLRILPKIILNLINFRGADQSCKTDQGGKIPRDQC